MTEPAGHVLIVEDEFLVALHLEALLEERGFANVHWANSVQSAECDLAEGVPLFAVLDINVGRELVFPFAEELRRRGLPFMFSSSVHPEFLPLEWLHHPFVAKPVDGEALAAMIREIHPSTAEDVAKPRPRTLGDVLYATSDAFPPEREWAALVQLVAASDLLALHALYERSHQLVATLINRITNSDEVTREFTIDVFNDISRDASAYDAAEGSVLGWIMNHARTRSLAQLRFEGRGESSHSSQSTLDRQASLAQRDVDEPLRLALRRAAELRGAAVPPRPGEWSEPLWEGVAPGIACKIFAADTERHIVSMLVRLAPGASYPPHTHAGHEELHLLDGELWIDDNKLCPGDYNYGAPGDSDQRVWSETGCTCVLVTSTQDILH